MNLVKFGVATFLGLFAIIGLGVMSFGIWSILEGNRSNNFPTVQGEVTKSEYVIVQDDRHDFITRADLTYSYTVAGTDYSSETRTAGMEGAVASPGEARRWTNEFPLGAKVDVYYDPAEPSKAVLRPGVNNIAWWMTLFGAVFAFIPVLMYFGVATTLNRFSGVSNGQRTALIGDTSRFASLFLMFFFGVFLIVGLVLFAVGWSMRQNESDSTAWPSTKGAVVYSGIRESTSRDNEGHQKTSFYPRVVYDFEIDGTTYTAEGITLSDSGSGKRRKAADAIAKYPVAAEVDVFFDPNDRYRATLVPGRSSGSLIFLIIGGVFSAVGGLAVVGTLIYRARQALKIGDAATIGGETDYHDPYRDSEEVDPFKAPWDNDDSSR